MLDYFSTANEAAGARDADIEWSVRHNQGGPRAVVQKYIEDGVWEVIHPKHRIGAKR